MSRWGASAAARAGVFAASWWWAAAAGLTAGALARLVSPHPDVVGAGVLFVAAAGCVLGAGLATRRARTRRWTARPHGPPPARRGATISTGLARLLDMICTRDTTISVSEDI